MLQGIIEGLTLAPAKKTVYMKMAKEYQNNLPDTLYLNPYQLTENLSGTAQDWKNFLKIPEVNRFVEGEMAMMAEISARSALQKLQAGGASSADISAAKGTTF